MVRRTCYQLSSSKAVTLWSKVVTAMSTELIFLRPRHWTTVVYRRDRQTLSTVQLCRAGQLAIADSHSFSVIITVNRFRYISYSAFWIITLLIIFYYSCMVRYFKDENKSNNQ